MREYLGQCVWEYARDSDLAGDERNDVDLPLRDELKRLQSYPEYGPDRVGLHAHADDDDAAGLGGGSHHLIEHSRHANGLEKTRLRPLPIRVQALITKPSGGDGSDFSYPA